MRQMLQVTVRVRLMVVATVCVLAGAVFASPAMAGSLLWNPGPKYRAGTMFTKTFSPANNYGCIAGWTTFAEAHLVGNPAGAFTSPLTCEGMQNVPLASNGAASSYYTAAMVGWTSADHQVHPGWDVWTLSGGGGTPIVTQFLNHARTASSPCTLREVGYSFQNWPYLPHSHFKPNPSGQRYTLGAFNSVLGKVTAKRAYAGGPLACTSLPTGIVTMDFRIVYENPNGTVVRSDVLGVLIDVMAGTVDMNGVDDEIFYQNESNAKLLYGNRIGLTHLTANWQSYSIDFKALIKNYIKPPNGFSVNDAIIGGFDVYTSVRGGDLDFVAKEVDVVGVP